MGRYDKDRFQKELAIRYCLARGSIPFLEVLVRTASELSDRIEVLTDLDVLGVSSSLDGVISRTIFDCKTQRMSPINRAFWASGVKTYVGADEAFVLMKAKAVQTHRLSALQVGVDLHDESTFTDLARTFDPAFSSDLFYQSSIDRWNALFELYEKNAWSEQIFDVCHNISPISTTPASTFRKVIADLRTAKGHFDPNKPAHRAIFFDILAALFVLWAPIGRDVRRFFEPTMSRNDFESYLRFYMWGGRESYQVRQQLLERIRSDNASSIELPAWNKLVSFAGIIVAAPQDILPCAHICREIAVRSATETLLDKEAHLKGRLRAPRGLQFIFSLSEYVVAATGLPSEMMQIVQEQAKA